MRSIDSVSVQEWKRLEAEKLGRRVVLHVVVCSCAIISEIGHCVSTMKDIASTSIDGRCDLNEPRANKTQAGGGSRYFPFHSFGSFSDRHSVASQ